MSYYNMQETESRLAKVREILRDKKLNEEAVDPWYYTPTGPIYAADVDNYSWF